MSTRPVLYDIIIVPVIMPTVMRDWLQKLCLFAYFGACTSIC